MLTADELSGSKKTVNFQGVPQSTLRHHGVLRLHSRREGHPTDQQSNGAIHEPFRRLRTSMTFGSKPVDVNIEVLDHLNRDLLHFLTRQDDKSVDKVDPYDVRVICEG